MSAPERVFEELPVVSVSKKGGGSMVPPTSPYAKPVFRWLDRLMPVGLAAFMVFIFSDFSYWLILNPTHVASWRALVFFAIWAPTTLFFVIMAIQDIYKNWNGRWEFAGAKERPPIADTIGRAKVELQMGFFRSTPGRRYDLSQNSVWRWLFHRRWTQLAVQLPNVIIFNIVIVAGLIGVADPNMNFATSITWYIWFAALFVLMVTVGRAWCLICPFSAQAEWIQRLGVFGHKKKMFTLNKKWPREYSTILITIFFFISLTWCEEFYNLAGPGLPVFTSMLVIGIISWDIYYALVFERRSFCHYGCPLSGLIGVVSALAPFEGFRAKDRTLCKTCTTKECMKGSSRSYGCSWYEYPGSMTSNFNCGLTGECFKGCPYENVGLAVHAPLKEAYQPVKKRFDIAISVSLLMGVVFYQIVNALPGFSQFDGWLSAVSGWAVVAKLLNTQVSGYPNPIDYFGFILLWPLLLVAVAKVGSLLTRGAASTREIMKRYAYGWIPLFGMTILARQLPKLLTNAPIVLKDLSDPFGFGWNMFGTANLPLQAHGAAFPWILWVQIGCVAVGAAAAVFVTRKITQLDFSGTQGAVRVNAFMTAVVLAIAAAGASMYFFIALTNPGHPMSPPF